MQLVLLAFMLILTSIRTGFFSIMMANYPANFHLHPAAVANITYKSSSVEEPGTNEEADKQILAESKPYMQSITTTLRPMTATRNTTTLKRRTVLSADTSNPTELAQLLSTKDT